MKLTFINLIVVDAYLKIKHSLKSRYSCVHNNILSDYLSILNLTFDTVISSYSMGGWHLVEINK